MALKDAYSYINTNLNLSFKLNEEVDPEIYYGCDDLIEDMEADIEKYGKDQMIRLYPDVLQDTLIFDNYVIKNDELTDDDYRPFIDLTFKQALNVYKLQNGKANENLNIEN
ncbi:hypothetical protein [Thomasclavelia sp.]|uniref:hypothetical protein n=1 Tax=Thomasclavelia sp. TaxID=3025757 RepID=UPI0025E71667|nr:hypothetical protein [Thomasclavelia sp.]